MTAAWLLGVALALAPTLLAPPAAWAQAPKRGLTCGPYSATTRPSAGHVSRPRKAPNPVPDGASPGAGRAGRLGGGTFATARRCRSCRSRMNASSRRVASDSSPTIRSW